MSALTDSKTEKVAQVIRGIYQPEIRTLLVVGCGAGIEAAILAQQLNAKVVGIDIENAFNEEALKFADLRTGDAMNLGFESDSFDFVFSYHALEHIEDPARALREMHRVLKVGGGYWIGTPNKSRIIGYIGAKNTSFAQKVRWNLADWKARLTGKFRNDLGAHAGFTSKELFSLLSSVFPTVNDLTKTYFLAIYQNHRLMVDIISKSRLSRFVYPSVYFSGIKGTSINCH